MKSVFVATISYRGPSIILAPIDRVVSVHSTQEAAMKDAIAKREELLEQLDILRQRVDRKGLPSMDFIVIANWYEVPFVE